MPTTFTSSLRLALPATGELDGLWGDTVNDSITSLVDTAVAGYASVTMTDADYTLTASNGVADEARNMFVDMVGTLTQARNVICPTAEKIYIFRNSTTGGFAVTLKTSAGTGISVPNGATMLLACDGTNVIATLSHFSSLTLASPLGVAYGGSGFASYTIGDITYASGTTTISKLAIGAANAVLCTNAGTTAPEWVAATGTGNVVRATSPTSGTVSLETLNLANALGAAYGGTGNASYTTGDMVYASGATTISKLAIGTANYVLCTNAGATAPEWVANTGTGNVVRATSPTLTTPTLGVATATSVTFGQDALNYYDEGTWTPAFAFAGGGSVTYSTQSGYYTRIGRQVTCVGTLTVDTRSAPSGNITITGWPFTVNASIDCVGTVANNGIVVSGEPYLLSVSGDVGLYYSSTSTGVRTQSVGSNINNDGDGLSFSFTYFV